MILVVQEEPSSHKLGFTELAMGNRELILQKTLELQDMKEQAKAELKQRIEKAMPSMEVLSARARHSTGEWLSDSSFKD